MGITINNNYGQVVETNYGTLNNTAGGAERTEHFPLHGNDAEGRELFVQLTASGFIDGNMDSWLYSMGYVAERPATLQPIEWKKNVQLAQEMLRLALEIPLKNKAISLAEMQKIASRCFVKDGNPLRLNKPKPEISADSDKLVEIFSDLKKSDV